MQEAEFSNQEFQLLPSMEQDHHEIFHFNPWTFEEVKWILSRKW